jgi:hypothetical protein
MKSGPDPRWALLAVWVIVAVLLASGIRAAFGHDWMSQDQKSYCCNDRDCKPYPREKVKRTADGWFIPEFNHLFPNSSGRVYSNPRPDLSEIFLCKLEWEDKPRCLFVQPEGS